jgi:hypothetical protein
VIADLRSKVSSKEVALKEMKAKVKVLILALPALPVYCLSRATCCLLDAVIWMLAVRRPQEGRAEGDDS